MREFLGIGHRGTFLHYDHNKANYIPSSLGEILMRIAKPPSNRFKVKNVEYIVSKIRPNPP
jgi:hypothetical protein